jgi:hypothetical protein
MHAARRAHACAAGASNVTSHTPLPLCRRGTIPETFSQLTQLQVLLLTGNQLTGSVPGFFGELPSLLAVFADANSLSGAVPSQLCRNNQTIWHLEDNANLCGGPALLLAAGLLMGPVGRPGCQPAGRRAVGRAGRVVLPRLMQAAGPRSCGSAAFRGSMPGSARAPPRPLLTRRHARPPAFPPARRPGAHLPDREGRGGRRQGQQPGGVGQRHLPGIHHL